MTSCTSSGRSEPAFGYADQPPLTPLPAHALDAVFGGSLVGLRAPSAVMGGLIVLLTGLIARELGAPRGAQVLAATCMAVGAALYAITHLLSTSTLDLLVWTSLSWLLVRALRAVGAVAGVTLAARVDNGVGLDNDEQGTPVWVVSEQRVPWPELWPPQLRRPG